MTVYNEQKETQRLDEAFRSCAGIFASCNVVLDQRCVYLPLPVFFFSLFYFTLVVHVISLFGTYVAPQLRLGVQRRVAAEVAPGRQRPDRGQRSTASSSSVSPDLPDPLSTVDSKICAVGPRVGTFRTLHCVGLDELATELHLHTKSPPPPRSANAALVLCPLLTLSPASI